MGRDEGLRSKIDPYSALRASEWGIKEISKPRTCSQSRRRKDISLKSAWGWPTNTDSGPDTSDPDQTISVPGLARNKVERAENVSKSAGDPTPKPQGVSKGRSKFGNDENNGHSARGPVLILAAPRSGPANVLGRVRSAKVKNDLGLGFKEGKNPTTSQMKGTEPSRRDAADAPPLLDSLKGKEEFQGVQTSEREKSPGVS